jgi:hypothetical protein
MESIPHPDAGIQKCLQELEVSGGTPPQDWETLKQAIQRQVAYLLNHQTERLMQILYRLDVRESKVAHVFETERPETWAEKIAGLVVDREKERLMWRKRYSEGETTH